MRNHLYVLCVFFSILLVIVQQASSQFMQWEQINGPHLGDMCSLAENHNGILFVGTEAGGIFRSIDRANSWLNSNNGLPPSLTVNTIVSSPNGYVFAGTGSTYYSHGDSGYRQINSVYRSTNNGEHWTKCDVGLPDCMVKSLIVDLNGFIYAGTLGTAIGSIFRSSNNGDSWESKSTGLPFRLLVNCMTVDDHGYLYAGTQSGIYRSTDRGDNWEHKIFGQSDKNVFALVVVRNDLICASVLNDGLYASSDSGSTWIKLLNNRGYNFYALAVDSSQNIFAGSDSCKIYYSSDSGKTWGLMFRENEDNLFLAVSFPINVILVSRNRECYAGAKSKGIYKSVDNGITWKSMSVGINAFNTQVLACNSREEIFVSGDGNCGGVFRSTDDGKTWKTLIEGFSDTSFISMVIDKDNNIYGGVPARGLYKSSNNGDHWERLYPTGSIQAIAIHQNESILISVADNIVTSKSHRCFISSDHGATWTAIDSLLGDLPRDFAINSKGDVFAATYSGIYRLTNHGSTWKKLMSGFEIAIPVHAIAVNSLGHLFAATRYHGIYKSTNNGESWHPVNNFLPTAIIPHEFQNMVIDPSNIIYASTWNHGIFISTNDGTSWYQNNSGLTSIRIKSLWIAKSGSLYAGSDGAGIFKGRIIQISNEKMEDRILPISMSNNFPNPFSLSTAISYKLLAACHVRLEVFDLFGRKVAALVDEVKEAGKHSVEFDASQLPNGVYLYRLTSGNRSFSMKAIVAK